MKLTVKLKRPFEKQFSVFMGASNISIDVCKIFSGKAQSMFVDMIAKDLQKNTNMFHPCPYQVGVISKILAWIEISYYSSCRLQGLQYMKDFHFDDTLFPSRMPVGRYIIQILMVSKRNGATKVIFVFRLFASLKNRSYGIDRHKQLRLRN